jgi:hypothetical protein
LKSAVPKCKNWNDLTRELNNEGIKLNFKYKGKSDEIQGIRFEKNDYTFNGSKIDRQFSFSKIDYQLNQNEKAQDFQAKQHQQNQFATLGNISSAIGGLFDFPSPTSDYDADEAQLLRQTKKKKKRKILADCEYVNFISYLCQKMSGLLNNKQYVYRTNKRIKG